MAKKKENKMKESQSMVDVIKDNYAWVVAIITLLGVIGLNIFRFIEYITGSAYFYYYGLDINLYKFYDQKFLYELCISLIFMFAMGVIMYCYKQISVNLKKKKIFYKENFYNLFIIVLSNFYLLFMENVEFELKTLIINFIVLIGMEIIFSFLAFKEKKIKSNEDLSFKQDLIDFIKFLPFFIIILIFLQMFKVYWNLSLKCEYRIIDESKVIVYSNNDYYLTLDCKIKEENLIIYKGTQEKINTSDVYSKLEKFNNVEVK